MNRNFRFLTMAAAALLSIGAGACRSKPYSPPPPERLSVPLDAGAWVVGYRDSTGPGEMIQYVPPRQSIENWTEMLTERKLPDLQKTSDPGESFADYQKTTNENCSDAKWTMIEQSSVDVVYEVEFGECKESKPQHEIGRFLTGDRALYQLLWQTKAEAVDQNTRNRWVDTMGKSAVVPY